MALSKDIAIIAGYQLVRGAAPASSTYLNLSQSYAANGEAAIVAQIQGATSGLTNAQLGSLIVSNAGFTNRPDLAQYVADVLGIFGAANRGQVVLNLAERLLSFTSDANYGAVATAFSNAVSSNLSYAQAPANTGDRPTSFGSIISNFTLTTGIDTFVGTTGNDTFTGDNATLGASDAIDGGAGIDTLNYSDASAAGVAPLGTVRNVELINIRNVNGTPGTAAVAEVAQVFFQDTAVAQNANTTFTFAGRTATLAGGAGAGGTTFTAAEIASAFTGTVVAGITMSGTLTNYTVGAGDAASTVKFTSTLQGNVPDLTNTGNGTTAGTTYVQGSLGTPGGSVALNINGSNFAGATDFNSNLSTGAVNFTNLTAGQKVGLIGNGVVVLGNVSAAYAAGVTATTINVSGGVGPANTAAPTVTITGPTVPNAATINSTGSVANTLGGVALGGQTTALAINADARLNTGNITGFNGTTATITVKGAAAGTATAAAVNLGTIEAGVRSIDASGLTVGGVNAVLNGNTAFSFVGGQGQDIVTTGVLLAGTASVDAGAGATDRLIVTDSNFITSTSGRLYKGFEQVQVNNGVNVDVTQLANTNTIDTIRISGGGAATGVTGLNATQAGNVSILAVGAGNITIGVNNATNAGQIDTVKAVVTNSNAAGTAAVVANLTAGGLTLNGVEKLELTTTGTTAATSGAVSFNTANALSLDSIKLTSAANSNLITVSANHVASNLAIDASASTGSVTLDATAYANGTTGAALTGGSGADTLLGATAKADRLIGGAGNDVIAGTAVVGITAGTATAIGAIGTSIAATAVADVLTGGAGRDVFAVSRATAIDGISTITDLDLGGTTAAAGVDAIYVDLAAASGGVGGTAVTVVTLTDAQRTTVSTQADLTAAINAALTVASAANNAVQFTFGTDTYLAINGANAGYAFADDAVVKITGVVGTLDATDIVVI